MAVFLDNDHPSIGAHFRSRNRFPWLRQHWMDSLPILCRFAYKLPARALSSASSAPWQSKCSEVGEVRGSRSGFCVPLQVFSWPCWVIDWVWLGYEMLWISTVTINRFPFWTDNLSMVINLHSSIEIFVGTISISIAALLCLGIDRWDHRPRLAPGTTSPKWMAVLVLCRTVWASNGPKSGDLQRKEVQLLNIKLVIILLSRDELDVFRPILIVPICRMLQFVRGGNSIETKWLTILCSSATSVDPPTNSKSRFNCHQNPYSLVNCSNRGRIEHIWNMLKTPSKWSPICSKSPWNPRADRIQGARTICPPGPIMALTFSGGSWQVISYLIKRLGI